MRKLVCLFLACLLLLSMTACKQTPDTVPTETTESTEPPTEAKILTAEELYRDFLAGRLQATDGSGNPFSAEKYTQQSGVAQYAIFDMNSDGTAELIVKTPWHFEILTAKDQTVTLWYEDAPYCRPLNNGAILYERPGGAPPHTDYRYTLLDEQGNGVYKLQFSQYAGEKAKDPYKYYVNETEVTQAAYDAVTGEIFAIGDDQLIWNPLGENGQSFGDYTALLESIRAENREVYYLLRDMDGDGVQELLLKEDTKLSVYTLTESVTLVGEQEFATGTLRLLYSDKTDYPGIFTFTVGGGANHYGYMTLKDGKISQEKLWDDFFSLADNDPGRVKTYSKDEAIIAESKTLYAKNKDLQFLGLTENLSADKELLMQVLLSEKPFTDESGKTVYLKDHNIFSYGGTMQGMKAVAEKYAFVDFDNDGTNELIVYVTPDVGAYMVFHIASDKVYGYEFVARVFTAVKQDGTFVASSGAAMEYFYRLSFQNEKCAFRELAYKCDDPKEQAEYRVDGKPVTTADFAAYYNAFAEKADAQWIELGKKK